MNASRYARSAAARGFDHHHFCSRDVESAATRGEVGGVRHAEIQIVITAADSGVRRTIVSSQYDEGPRGHTAPQGIRSKGKFSPTIIGHAGRKIFYDHAPHIQAILNDQ